MSANQPIQIMDNQFTEKEVYKGKQMLNSPLITDAGRRWLIRALDPFHDTEVLPAGYPDFEMSATVVQEVNQSFSITMPPGNVGPWDAHVFNAPFFASREESISFWGGYEASTGNISFPYSPGANMPDSGVICAAVSTGNDTLPDVAIEQPVTTLSYKSVNPFGYISAPVRVVGLAFEVINTTATIYQQGLATAYRMPQYHGDLTWARPCSNTVTSITVPVGMEQFAMPPSNPAEAIALPGSKQWPASRGYYGVCTMTNENNILQTNDNRKVVWLPRPTNSSAAAIGAVISAHPASDGVSAMLMTNRWFAPYNTTGAYFTGLSEQTTLQVNVKWLLESAPGPRSVLATLAQPSPSYDGEAIRLYTLLASKLPVGVPFDENPAGEWFDCILGIMGAVSSAVSFVHPILGAVGGGLTGVARLISQATGRSATNPKPMVLVEKPAKKAKTLPSRQRQVEVLVPRTKTRKRR